MEERVIDLEELDRLWSGLRKLKSHHIVSPHHTHLANLCEGNGECVAMMRKEWADSLEAICNAYPEMASIQRDQTFRALELTGWVNDMGKRICELEALLATKETKEL